MDSADIAHGGYFLCYRSLGPGLEDRGEVWKDGKMRCGRSWREVAADWGSLLKRRSRCLDTPANLSTSEQYTPTNRMKTGMCRLYVSCTATVQGSLCLLLNAVSKQAAPVIRRVDASDWPVVGKTRQRHPVRNYI